MASETLHPSDQHMSRSFDSLVKLEIFIRHASGEVSKAVRYACTFGVLGRDPGCSIWELSAYD